MIGSRASADVAEALAVLTRAARSLADGAELGQTLAELAEASARGTGAEVAVIWLPERDGDVVARSVWSASAGLAAELEGLRAGSFAAAAAIMRERLDESVSELTVPLDAAGGGGALALARRGPPFEQDELRLAALAAELAGLAGQVESVSGARGGNGVLDVAGDALAVLASEDGAPARVARLAAVASGGDAAVVWGLRGETLEVTGTYGPIVVDDELALAANAVVEEAGAAVAGAAAPTQLVTLQLGRPVFGVLQVRFAAGRAPGRHGVEQLASFAVRAAHVLRSSELAHDAGLELERGRALLSVLGEAISQLSLAHTLETVIERVAHLLDTDRVAVYLTDGEEIAAAASRGLDGPHGAVAPALLAAALQSRHAGSIVELDAADERLDQVRAQVEESGIDSVLALGLVVRDEPIGVLAVYPRRPRPVTENERVLLTALAGQLAVVVENARLHEHVTALNAELRESLASELEKSKRLHAQHEISRTFAQSLSLGTTLDVLASSIVELLGVDAAVIRMPDERGVDFVARAVHIDDERVDPAARALLSRAQPPPRRELLALLRRGEPLVLDPELAESFGGALALLAPFLRKGSSAAVIPVATPTELLATLTIVSLHPGRPVAGEIAETALAIAGQAALAIDNARLYGQQKAFADTMQRSLLPRGAPELPGLELGDVYESAAKVEVGGDVYDYLTLGDGRLAVVLGDVTGHGVDATADMAMAKYVFRSLGREHPDPGTFLAVANDVVSSEIAPGRFITMVELVFDAVRGEVACASAGHPPPRLVLPDGTVESIPVRGLALGIDAPQEYATVTEPFPPGATVVVYTDGVIEARRGGEQFGVERLDALLAERRQLPPQAIAEAALAACRDWTEGELTDDVAVVVVKRAAAE